MVNIIYEAVVPTLIENTTMKKVYRDGIHMTYYITPDEGYILHDNTYDYTDQEGKSLLGYRTTTATCGADYNFSANPREFCAYKEEDAPKESQEEATEDDYQVALRSMGVDV